MKEIGKENIQTNIKSNKLSNHEKENCSSGILTQNTNCVNKSKPQTKPSKSLENQKNQNKFLKQLIQNLGLVQNNQQDENLYEKAYEKFQMLKQQGKIPNFGIKKDENKTKQHKNILNSKRGDSLKRGILKKMQEESRSKQKKRVKLIQPETSRELQKIKNELSQNLYYSLKILSQGNTFLKYCYSKQKIEEVYIYFSFDFQHFVQKTENKEPILRSMNIYRGVSDGCKSKKFQQYIKKSYPISEQLSFSIYLTDRSIDLVTLNKEEKDKFVYALQIVKIYNG